jgi:hypothetical protein
MGLPIVYAKSALGLWMKSLHYETFIDISTDTSQRLDHAIIIKRV